MSYSVSFPATDVPGVGAVAAYSDVVKDEMGPGRLDIYSVTKCKAYPVGLYDVFVANASSSQFVEPGLTHTLLCSIRFNGPDGNEEDSKPAAPVVEYCIPGLTVSTAEVN